jgi:RNA polymerase sigma-70 factor, ECF subfamily
MKSNYNCEQLIQRAISGDGEAFGEIVHAWEKRIYALCYGILGTEQDARDATQETFIAAYRNLKSFRGEAKVSSWLHRIAVNQCITRQRRSRVRGETPIDDLGDTVFAHREFASFDSPSSMFERKETSQIVQTALRALPFELQEVLLLKEYEEMTFQEISDTLNIPLSTVKSRLYTGLKQLKLRLEKYRAKDVLDEQKIG